MLKKIFNGFKILISKDGNRESLIPPDVSICDDCNYENGYCPKCIAEQKKEFEITHSKTETFNTKTYKIEKEQ